MIPPKILPPGSAFGLSALEMWNKNAVASTVAEGWTMAQETLQAVDSEAGVDGPGPAEVELARHIVWLTHWWYLLRDERQDAIGGLSLSHDERIVINFLRAAHGAPPLPGSHPNELPLPRPDHEGP